MEDPETGYRRRVVSPPSSDLRGELVEVRIRAGTTVSFDASPIAGLEHHLWMLEGSLTLEVEGSLFPLRAGDCLRYVLVRPDTLSRHQASAEARYSSRWCSRERSAEPARQTIRIEEWQPDCAGAAPGRRGHRHAGRGVARRRPRRRRRQLLRPVLARRSARLLAREGAARVCAPERAASWSRVWDARIVGTVTLDLAVPPNQRHRAEVAKMLVHPTRADAAASPAR